VKISISNLVFIERRYYSSFQINQIKKTHTSETTRETIYQSSWQMINDAYRIARFSRELIESSFSLLIDFSFVCVCFRFVSLTQWDWWENFTMGTATLCWKPMEQIDIALRHKVLKTRHWRFEKKQCYDVSFIITDSVGQLCGRCKHARRNVCYVYWQSDCNSNSNSNMYNS